MTTLWNAVTFTAWALLGKLEAPLCTPLKEKKAAAAAVMRRAYHCCNLLEASLCNLATAAGLPQVRAQDAQVGLAFMSKVCRQHTWMPLLYCSYCAHAYTSSYQATRYLRRLPCCCTSEEGQLDLAEKIFERASSAVHKRVAVSADYSPWPSQGQ